MRHLCLAANFDAVAKNPKLVLSAAQCFWNVVLSLTVSSVTRRILFEPLRTILDELAAAGVARSNVQPAAVKSALEFCVHLYVLLFECYAMPTSRTTTAASGWPRTPSSTSRRRSRSRSGSGALCS